MNDPIPKEKKRSNVRKWILRILLFLVAWVIVFFFIFGPGRVLFPVLLNSYSNVTDKTNTVYYSGEYIIEAMDILWMASVVQDSIRSFWNDTSDRVFRKGVTIFLCESSDQYYHLTWNRAMGSAMMGRIVLNPEMYGTSMSLYSALAHEMSHLYMSHRYGYFPSVFLLPKWFDEGCATMMQDYSYAARHMNNYLKQNPELVSVTSLKHPWNWQTMVRMENGKMAAKGYGQVYLFTRYLINNYGIEKVRDYASRLSWNFRTEKTFAKVFPVPLREAERSWLKIHKEADLFPEQTLLVPLPFDFMVFLRWIFILVIVLTPVVIFIRWLFLKFFHK